MYSNLQIKNSEEIKLQYGSSSYKLNLRDFRHNSRNGTYAMSFIEKIYPDRIFRIRDVEKGLGANRMAYRLKRQNCLEMIDTAFPSTYRLTMQGRCRFLCFKLDVCFLSLCMMIEGYMVHKQQNMSGGRLIYPIHDMMDAFDGVYTEKSIRNTASLLCRKGLASSISKNIIQISKAGMNKLARHERTVCELHEWIIGMPNRLNRMALEEYHSGRIPSHTPLNDEQISQFLN